MPGPMPHRVSELIERRHLVTVESGDRFQHVDAEIPEMGGAEVREYRGDALKFLFDDDGEERKKVVLVVLILILLLNLVVVVVVVVVVVGGGGGCVE